MEKVALKLLEKENINYNQILPDPPADQQIRERQRKCRLPRQRRFGHKKGY